MNWWHELFSDRVKLDAPLGALTWFGLGGRARYLVETADVDDLCLLQQRVQLEGLQFRVMGRGANLLVRDEGFDGVVVRLGSTADGTSAFSKIRFDREKVEAGAGVSLIRLIKMCSWRGLSGLEGLAGIPATVGGAVRMNAGGQQCCGEQRCGEQSGGSKRMQNAECRMSNAECRMQNTVDKRQKTEGSQEQQNGGVFGKISDVVESVDVLTTSGKVETRKRQDVAFGYRRSGLQDCVVLGAKFNLTPEDPAVVKQRFKDYWHRKRSTQPIADRSAGCIFKNPPDGRSAGKMIDQAGLKGYAHGGAKVSNVHGNFIVATKDAKAADVIYVMEHVRDRVLRVFDVELELELEIW